MLFHKWPTQLHQSGEQLLQGETETSAQEYNATKWSLFQFPFLQLHKNYICFYHRHVQ